MSKNKHFDKLLRQRRKARPRIIEMDGFSLPDRFIKPAPHTNVTTRRMQYNSRGELVAEHKETESPDDFKKALQEMAKHYQNDQPRQFLHDEEGKVAIPGDGYERWEKVRRAKNYDVAVLGAGAIASELAGRLSMMPHEGVILVAGNTSPESTGEQQSHPESGPATSPPGTKSPKL